MNAKQLNLSQEEYDKMVEKENLRMKAETNRQYFIIDAAD